MAEHDKSIFDAMNAVSTLLSCELNDDDLIAVAIRICSGIVGKKTNADTAKTVHDHLSEYLKDALEPHKEA